MPKFFEELDYQKTPLGELVLHKRQSPSVPEPVYEVKLNDELLMSSSVSFSEEALATLALEPRKDRPLEVLIGGLGLGHTAAAALAYPTLRHLTVVELLEPVIHWHRSRLVPLAETLIEDRRCDLVQGDFFDYIRAADRSYDAVLLDIDHAPDCFLHPRHSDFYTADGLEPLRRCLRAGAVFGLWSTWKPDAAFLETLAGVFSDVQAHEVSFVNPHMNETYANWVVTAEKP